MNAPNDNSNLVDRNLPPTASLPKSKKRRFKEQQLFATSPTEEQLEVASQASSRNMFVTPDKKKARQGTAMDRLAAQQEALNKKTAITSRERTAITIASLGGSRRNHEIQPLE